MYIAPVIALMCLDPLEKGATWKNESQFISKPSSDGYVIFFFFPLGIFETICQRR